MGRVTDTPGTDAVAADVGPTLGYQPALDGIRAFAVVAVIASHSSLWPHPGGYIGVDVFFTLSGFLITAILLAEWSTDRRIRLGAFYRRRLLRLTPPLVAFVAVTAAWYEVVGSPAQRHAVTAGLPWILTYVGNWAEVRHVDLGPFSHLWSLAVEEQFYLLWAPLVAVALSSRWRERAVSWAAVGGLAACTVARLYPLASGGAPRGGYGTDVQCDGIFLGCALAVAWHRDRLQMTPGRRRWLGVGGALILVDLGRHATLPGGTLAGEALVLAVAVATLAVIASVILEPTAPLARLLSCRPATWIGRRSYAIYLWHFPFTWALATHGAPPAARFLCGLGGSVLLAELSMDLIEGRVARWRRGLSARPARAPDEAERAPAS